MEKLGLRIELMAKDSINLSSEGFVSKIPIRVYNINGEFTPKEVDSIIGLLADPIADDYRVDGPLLGNIPIDIGSVVIEMSPKPGVNDPEGKAVKEAIERKIKKGIEGVSFAKQYLWKGSLDEKQYTELQKQLGNPLINEFRRVDPEDWNIHKGIEFHFPEVKLPEVEAFSYVNIDVGNEELKKISEDRLLELNLKEMQAIQNLFKDKKFLKRRDEAGLKNIPTDAELESIAQTWSEHCKHKKFNAKWVYTSEALNDKSNLPYITDSIFKSIIVSATEKISSSIDWIVSVFEDNAGVIKLNDRWNIAHKVETHNFPSSLDPFGGANTGSGGVFRDPKSTGIGMMVVSSQYGFRIANPPSYKDIPTAILGGEKILKGVVLGVEDYGNKMGIPTMCGNVFVDDGWLKPAVYVGAVSVQKAEINGRKTHEKIIEPGYIGLSLGGKVGKDGIHGATASSTDQKADAEKDIQVNQAVQIGDPIVEKGVFEVMDILTELSLVEATQDCGAGGWNSAVGELAKLSNGVEMDLTYAPEKYRGLTGWEKLVSEAQEREIIVIKPESLERILEICKHNNVEATKIAVFNDSGYYHVKDKKKTIVFIPIDFLHQGLPQWEIKAHWTLSKNKEPEIQAEDLTDTLLKLTAKPNMQNYDWITTRYDHEVQGGSLIKPLIGIGHGRSDAIAYHPVLGEKEVVIESVGSNPWQGDIDAYHMGRNNIVDAIGKIIALGGNLDRITFNGNTTCPKPEKDPYVAAQVIRMLKGAADAEIVFGTPTISGKDSTSMERSYISTETGKEVRVKAKPELLMSALGVIHDDSTLTTPDFKVPGDFIYVVGETHNELGASEFYLMHNETGRNVPKSDLEKIKSRYIKMSEAIKQKLVHSAQYISKGGLIAAVENSAIAGELGVDVKIDSIDNLLKAYKILFSETTGRFVVSIHPSKKQEFESLMKSQYIREIGTVRSDIQFNVMDYNEEIIKTNVDMLREVNKRKIRY